MNMMVDGSDHFRYEETTESILREKAGRWVELHSPGTAADNIDPLSAEIIRHRLWAITDEMGHVMKSMSGSIVVTDANDFGVSVMDEIGRQVQIGAYNPALSVSMGLAVEWTLANRAEDPGIRPGDMFLCNDPWIGGGLHQNDVAVYAPVFCEGTLFGWTCAVAHQLDLGGVSPGSWSVESRDVFWESLPTPPIRIVEGGAIRRDMEDAYIRRSRVPAQVALDLRAKIGANNSARESLLRLLETYGATTVKGVMRQVMDDAERGLRAKLSELPDGRYSSVAYQDQARVGDRRLHQISLVLTKTDSDLVFDFAGTDPEVEGLINSTYAGLYGGIMVPVLTLLCGDIPWAPGGIRRALRIVSEPGSLNICNFPAGISKASVASTAATANAAYECISNLLDTGRSTRDSVMSVCKGSAAISMLSGLDQRSRPFVAMLTDHVAGGLGARTDKDGVDTGGSAMMTMPRSADVEITEYSYPVLYLWRREEADSGGAGRFRGGLSGSACFMLHDAPGGTLRLTISAAGKALPQSSGLAGGYPGGIQRDLIIRNSSVRALLARGQMPSDVNDFAGEMDIAPPHLETMLAGDDIYFTNWQGGGGYGDPLLREPERVLADLLERKVSGQAALALYGVVIAEDGRIDLVMTEANRASRLARNRDQTAGGSALAQAPAAAAGKREGLSQPVDDNLEFADRHFWCRHCGGLVGDQGGFLRDAVWQEIGLVGETARHAALFVDARVVLRQAACRECGVRLLIEAAPANKTGERKKMIS